MVDLEGNSIGVGILGTEIFDINWGKEYSEKSSLNQDNRANCVGWMPSKSKLIPEPVVPIFPANLKAVEKDLTPLIDSSDLMFSKVIPVLGLVEIILIELPSS